MRDICSVMDDHDAMDALADRLICLARPGCGSDAQCHALLCSFRGQLAAHLAAEASFLDAGPGRDRPGLFETELRALREDFVELSEGWAHYLGRWTQAAIAADRAAFSQETGDMMTAFKLRIERESRIIYPLALEAGRICPPAG